MNFRIGISSNVKDTATQDADALAKLEKQLRKDENALAVMEKQMRALNKASVVDIATAKQLDAAIKSQRDKVAGLTQTMVGYGQQGLDVVTEKQEGLTKALEGLANRAGPLGDVLTKLGPVGLAAAAGIGAIAIAAGVATAALGKLIQVGSEMSEKKLDNVNMLETLFRSQKAAEHTYDVIVDVTKRVAISQDRALDVADAMAKSGVVSGDAMVRAVESVGKAEAARKGAGQAIQGIMERAERARSMGWAQAGFSVSRDELRQAGLTYADLAKTLAKQTGRGVQEAATALMHGRVSVAAGLDALNATIDEKLGPLAEKKFYTLGAALQRMRDRIGGLFARMDLGPIARAFDQLGHMFDESTVTGQALQEIMQMIFKSTGEAIEGAVPKIQAFVDEVILAGLKAYNGLYPIRRRFAELADFVEQNAVPIMIGALAMLTPAIWSAATAMASFAASVLLAVGPWVALGVAVAGFAKLMMWTWETASNIDWGYIGDQIKAAFSDAFKWVTDAASKAWETVKSIFSAGGKVGPSSSGAAALAGFSAGGYTGDAGRSDVAGVVHGQEYVMPADATKRIGRENLDAMRAGQSYATPAATASSITNNSRASNATITFAEGSIVINGASNAEQLRTELPRVLADVFEQLGLTLGTEAVA